MTERELLTFTLDARGELGPTCQPLRRDSVLFASVGPGAWHGREVKGFNRQVREVGE